MGTAQKILVVYGTLSLGYGFVLGIPISQARMRAPEASRHLVIAHLSAIIQGAVHLGLSVALGDYGGNHADSADVPFGRSPTGARRSSCKSFARSLRSV